MDLLRKYFSVRKVGDDKKFNYPIDENGNEFNKKKEELYDDIQYCAESDVECTQINTQRQVITQRGYS